MARSERAEARAAEWAAKKEKLQKALEAKDSLLKEVASKNVNLAADLDKALAIVEELEIDAHMLRRGKTDLAIEARLARAQLEVALKEAAELDPLWRSKRPSSKRSTGPSLMLPWRRECTR